MSNPVLHFDLPAEEPEKLAPLEPGINGGIGKRQTPDQRLMNYVNVRSIDDAVKKVEKAGGTITMPKTEMPGVGELAVAVDIEGNPFGLWSIPE